MASYISPLLKNACGFWINSIRVALHITLARQSAYLIHNKPEAPWTVATLADTVNMSRTSFATKFAALVKTTPIDYLTSWRMQKAVALMRGSEENLEGISNLVGYTSRAAFAKAFKKEFGHSPGEYRDKLNNGKHVALVK